MLKEDYLQILLKELYQSGELNVYDYAAKIFTLTSDEFANAKSWADQLVKDKLAVYADPEHTVMQISNFGKFWILKGGYTSFLEQGQSLKDSFKEKDEKKIQLIRREKEELIEARLKLTHYRLVGFWLTILISSIGFLLSLYNLYLIMKGRK